MCINVYQCVYLMCIPMCATVYQCIPMCTNVYSTNVYQCVPMCILDVYTNVYQCIPMCTQCVPNVYPMGVPMCTVPVCTNVYQCPPCVDYYAVLSRTQITCRHCLTTAVVLPYIVPAFPPYLPCGKTLDCIH